MMAIECEDKSVVSPSHEVDGASDVSEPASKHSSAGILRVKNEYQQTENVKSISNHFEEEVPGSVESCSKSHSKINETSAEDGGRLNDSGGNADLDECAMHPVSTVSSTLNPNYQRQSVAPSLFWDQGQSYAHTFTSESSMHGSLSNDDHEAWRPEPNNATYLGYHAESNERTKVLPNNSIWQMPPNPIGRDLSLLQTTATSIARTHPIVKTHLRRVEPTSPFQKLPRPFSRPAPSKLNNSSLVSSQSHPLPYNRARVNSNGVRRPAIPTSKLICKPNTALTRSCQSILAQDQPLPRNMSDKKTTATSKKRARSMNRRQVTLEANAEDSFSGNNFPLLTDHEHVQDLLAAMNDMSASEDNEGIIKFWEKIRLSRPEKVREVCEEILVAAKKANAPNGQPLCDRKRTNNQYDTVEDRLEAICDTLKTQKTVCKHLMEDPYLYQVVDDPIYASTRVANNRRVNKGKKAAIERGRKIMGLKGNGKGRPLIKSDDEAAEDQGPEEDPSEDGESAEGDEYEASSNQVERLDNAERPNLRDRSTMKKPTYVCHDSDKDLEVVGDEFQPPSESSKRQKRSKDPGTVTKYPTIASANSSATNMNNVNQGPGTLPLVDSPMGNAPIMWSDFRLSSNPSVDNGSAFSKSNVNGTTDNNPLSSYSESNENPIPPYNHSGSLAATGNNAPNYDSQFGSLATSGNNASNYHNHYRSLAASGNNAPNYDNQFGSLATSGNNAPMYDNSFGSFHGSNNNGAMLVNNTRSFPNGNQNGILRYNSHLNYQNGYPIYSELPSQRSIGSRYPNMQQRAQLQSPYLPQIDTSSLGDNEPFTASSTEPYTSNTGTDSTDTSEDFMNSIMLSHQLDEGPIF